MPAGKQKLQHEVRGKIVRGAIVFVNISLNSAQNDRSCFGQRISPISGCRKEVDRVVLSFSGLVHQGLEHAGLLQLHAQLHRAAAGQGERRQEEVIAERVEENSCTVALYERSLDCTREI